MEKAKVIPLDESLKILREIEGEERDKAVTEPVVLIWVWNGLVDDIEANFPCQVIRLEHDKYREIEGKWIDRYGYKYQITRYEVEGEPARVAETVRDMGGL